jgi:hypothetical protein
MKTNLKSIFKFPKGKTEQIYFSFIWIIRLLLISALFIEGFYQQWEFFFVTTLALILTLIPYFFEKKLNIKTPLGFHLFIILFIYAGIYLGEVRNFYYRFLWWGTMLHVLAGFAMGLIGFAIIFLFYKANKIKAHPLMISIFAFCFSNTLSIIWEIFEFSMDTFFGLNMQKTHIGTGVTDTMIDMIVNAIGALIASIIGYIYLKTGRSKLYNKIIKFILRKNPHLTKNSSK